ncbi:MAG: protein phosphatase 2C domain-containing protein, partial [Acidimicrobiales bacterium]
VEAFQADRTASGLAAAVRRANREVWRRSRGDRQLHGMGTTLTAAALVHGEGDEEGAANHLALVNIGDSRAYRLDRREGKEPGLSRLTEDHSVVEEMVRQGELTPAEAAVHPHRHVLTRALGIDSEVDLDIWDLQPIPGTRLLLCSDGLTDEVPEAEIAGVLAGSEDLGEVARELVARALAHGGMDNVTVVVVDVLDGTASTEQQLVETVPPLLPTNDEGEDRLGPDVTQALPVTRPKRRWGSEPRATAAGAVAGLGIAAEAEAAAEARLAQSEAATAAAPPLYDREFEDADPTIAAPVRPDGAAPEAATGGDPPAGVAGTAPADDSERRRAGRTMRVRAASQVGSTPEVASPPAMHPRGTVLVPTRDLSKQYRDQIATFRVFLFLVVLAGLLGGVVAVVIWFQRSSFFVGLDGNRIGIYQGRPHGMLWFKPQLLETSQITTKNLLPNSVSEVRSGIVEPSYPAAKQEVASLARLSTELGMNSRSRTTTTSTTVLGGVPSTTAPALLSTTTTTLKG